MHSKDGGGTLEGSGRGEIRVAEHLKVKKFPAIPGPEDESVTWVLNVVPKFTAYVVIPWKKT